KWDKSSAVVLSEKNVSVQRSPYMKYSLYLWLRAPSMEELLKQVTGLEIVKSYKVVALESVDGDRIEKLHFAMRRQLERALGEAVGGSVELNLPELLLGVLQYNEQWLLVRYEQHEAAWQ